MSLDSSFLRSQMIGSSALFVRAASLLAGTYPVVILDKAPAASAIQGPAHAAHWQNYMPVETKSE